MVTSRITENLIAEARGETRAGGVEANIIIMSTGGNVDGLNRRIEEEARSSKWSKI